METVFDYNITDKEREDIGISDKDRYLAIVGEDTANLDLATLFIPEGIITGWQGTLINFRLI